jgi:hypothetical protein
VKRPRHIRSKQIRPVRIANIKASRRANHFEYSTDGSSAFSEKTDLVLEISSIVQRCQQGEPEEDDSFDWVPE